MLSYFRHIKVLVYRILFLLAFMAVTRLIFYIFNYSTFADISFHKMVLNMIFGMRFDLSVIAWFNILFLIMHVIPGEFKNAKWYQIILKIQFFITSTVIILSNLADTEYFKFTRKRSTAYVLDLFSGNSIEADATRQLPMFLVQFWYLSLIGIVLLILFWIFYPKLKKEEYPQSFITSNFVAQTLYAGIAVYLFIIMARGGLQYKPISNISAAAYGTPSEIPLILNTPFSVMTTLGKKKIQPRKYFTQEDQLKYFSPKVTLQGDSVFQKRNVVLIILESFSKEYIGFYNNGKGYTPFFDSILANSYTFSRAYANGMQSIESLPSILSGIPALMESPYITSDYVSNHITSLAAELGAQGYYTAMFHGATNGSMGFESFAKLAGFQDYFGRTQYKNEKDYDGQWGIYDEYFMQYAANELNKKDTPFMACIFTLSSHHPFKVPAAYKNKFTKGEMPIHNVISYADMSLQKFMHTASSMPWFKNTLFVFTADHCGPSMQKSSDASPAKFAIPIAFYAPFDSSFTPRQSNVLAQQTDIFPSVLDYLGYSGSFISFGKSLFEDSDDKYAVNYLNGVYQLFYKNYVLQFDGEKTLAVYDLNDSIELKNNLKETIDKNLLASMENKLKAIIQELNTRMITNTLKE